MVIAIIGIAVTHCSRAQIIPPSICALRRIELSHSFPKSEAAPMREKKVSTSSRVIEGFTHPVGAYMALTRRVALPRRKTSRCARQRRRIDRSADGAGQAVAVAKRHTVLDGDDATRSSVDHCGKRSRTVSPPAPERAVRLAGRRIAMDDAAVRIRRILGDPREGERAAVHECEMADWQINRMVRRRAVEFRESSTRSSPRVVRPGATSCP